MIEIILPAMGEGIIEAEITRWLAGEGDPVTADMPVVEVATDKVDSEVVSPASGILHKILLEEGDVAKVGQVMAMIRSADDSEPAAEEGMKGEDISDRPAEMTSEKATATEDEDVADRSPQFQTSDSKFQTSDSRLLPGQVFLSPQVRKTIQEYQLSQAEVSSIRGTGKNGRITHRDLMDYLSGRKPVRREQGQASQVFPDPAAPPEHTTVNISREMIYGDESNEVVEMDRMRRLIADHMTYFARVSPHVTSFVEADVTNLVMWREKVKDLYQEKHGQKLTYTPLVIEAAVKAIKEFPGINVSLDGYRIIHKKQVNIGMAAALPSGNLIVPVIREANNKNLHALVKEVNDLAQRARDNKLKPTDIQGSTFSVTNLGQFGNSTGTPIINQPEVAILAVGAISKKPAVVKTPDGDAIGIRHMVILSLSYDHRVVDGALGGSFLKRIGDHLENAEHDREI